MAAKAAALKEDGHLGITTAHMLYKVMPDAINPAAGAGPTAVTAHLLNYLLVPPAVFSPAVRKGAVHWAMDPDRCAQWMMDLDDAGLDTEPIPGPLAVAAPVLRNRILAVACGLTAAQRLVDVGHLIFDK